jgi:hypothetical protein
MLPQATPQRADAKLQAIPGPGFLLDLEQMTKISLRVAQTVLQAADRFVLAKAMRDGHNQRLRHEGSIRSETDIGSLTRQSNVLRTIDQKTDDSRRQAEEIAARVEPRGGT